jgi:hypothetical protein
MITFIFLSSLVVFHFQPDWFLWDENDVGPIWIFLETMGKKNIKIGQFGNGKKSSGPI